MPRCTSTFSLLFYSWDSSVVFVQFTQQVFVAKEWVRDACNEAKAEALSRVDVEKSLGALKQEQAELFEKLKEADKARLNAEAGLKNAEMQAEDQRKQLQMIEIELATSRQLVLDLKVELEKAKDVARVAREAFEDVEMASYKCGVLETETRLAEEVAGMCRDYCIETWAETLNQAGVLADSELRRAKNVFFPEDIREVPAKLPPSKQLPTVKAPPSDADKVSAGVGKGKEVQPPVEAKQFEDMLTIKDVVSKENPPQAKE